jgi:hypothetical protein
MWLKKLALGGALVALSMSTASTGEPAKKDKHQATSALKPQAADVSPQFGPPPAWARPEKVPPANPKHKDDPFEFLLSNSQERVSKTGLENYVEYVVQPLNQLGLQAVGNVVIPWNIQRTDLTLNRVNIERDGKTIDALNPADVSVIRRETQLEASTLTGIRTVVMPVRGLQVGDKLSVAFTYKTKPRVVGQTEEIQDLAVPVYFDRLVKRFVVSKDLSVRWSMSPGLKASTSSETPNEIEQVFTAERAEPVKSRDYVPTRFKHKIIQVSAFKDWSDVAGDLAPMFDAARKTADNSEVAALAAKIAAANKDPRQRMLAALRVTQDQVRYVALLLGDGDYKPMTADAVWAQRFGDCKGKSALLLALLDDLGISAEPVLASVKFDDLMDQRLPTLAMFDHMYVRAHIGPDTYYLDGTRFGQRTLEELQSGTTVHVLPLIANAKLETIPDVMPSTPLLENTLLWDARNGILGKVPFEATLTLRGEKAAEMRATAAVTDQDKLIESYKNKLNGVSNDNLEYVSADASAPDGSYVVKFKGAVELDWTAVEGLKGNRLELVQAPLNWDGKLDRDGDGEGKDLPVLMQFPYWDRVIEKVLLPNGGKDFVLDVPPIDQTIAVTHMSRTVTMADGVVTAISDFKRLKSELDAASARSAKGDLEKISTSYGYVVSKKKLNLPK